jgi:hypothetical protein
MHGATYFQPRKFGIALNVSTTAVKAMAISHGPIRCFSPRLLQDIAVEIIVRLEEGVA